MNSQSSDNIPEPLSASHEQSFAYHTIQSRFPEIVTKAIDTFHRQWKHIDPTADDEAKQVLHELSRMRYQLMTNKPLEPMQVESSPDYHQWTEALKEEEHRVSPRELTWFTGSWLFVECYGYRKIVDILMQSSKFSSYDPFFEQKSNTLINNMQSINKLAPFLDDMNTDLRAWFELSLWGNRCDLSLKPTTPSYSDILQDLKGLRGNIVVNQLDEIIARVEQLNSRSENKCITIDFVMDNAGFECFTDFCLINRLTNMFGDKLNQVRIHIKRYPWFVSDVTEKDFNWVLDQLTDDKNACSQLKALADRWKEHIKCGKWKLIQSTFWTLSHDFSSMKRVDCDLYGLLEASCLILFKGDLNYRKLLGDLNWPHSTPFNTVLRDFKPAFLATLRTNKADLICGVDNSLESTLPTDYMVTGEYAVIQVYNPNNQ